MLKCAIYASLALILSASVQAKVDAVDGYVRLLPPGSPNTAAFLLLKNDGDQPVKLMAASSPAAKRAELHAHIHEQGVMKMRQVESIIIPAKGEVALKPGSFHIMLFEVGADLSQGTPFPLTLTLDNGQKLQLSLPLKPIEPMAAMAHGH